MFKKLFSDSLFYAIGPQLPKLAGLFLLPVMTLYLTSEDYGIYGIAMAYIAGMSGLKELGFTQVMVNYFYRSTLDSDRWKLVWRQLLGVLYLWGIAYAIILGGVIYATLSHKVGDEIWKLIALVVLPAVFFENTIMYGSRFFQMAQRPQPMALNAVLSGIVSLVVNYVTVVYMDMHYMGFFWALFASSLVSFLFFIYPVYFKFKFSPVFNVKKTRLFSYLKVSLPTIPHNYSSYLLNTSDRIILDRLHVPLNLVGQYNFAYQFGNYVDMLGSSVGAAVSPFYMRLYSKNTSDANYTVRSLTFFLQGLFLFGSTLLVLWCKEIFFFLSANKELASSYPIAIIIIMSYAYRPMYWGTVNRLGFAEKTQHLWKISFIGGLVNVILNLIFIPIWGIYATALSTFIGLMYIGFSGYFLKSFREIEKVNYHPLSWMSLISVVAMSMYLIKDIDWFYKVLTSGLIIALGAILVFRYKEELQKLNRSF